MSVTISNIIPSGLCPVAQTTKYTSSNCKTIIDSYTVTNISAGTETISVNLVASGGSASSSNLIIKNQSVLASECISLTKLIGKTLGVNDFISVIASSGTALVENASGRLIT